MSERSAFGRVFAPLYCAYSLIYVARLNLSAAAPALEAAGKLTVSQVGTVGAAFSLAFALGKLLGGGAADRVNPKKLIALGCAVSAAANLALAALPPFAVFCLLWAVSGLAQSLVWGPMLRLIAAAAPDEKRGKAASLLVTSVAVGSLLGLFLATELLTALPAGWAFVLPGLLLAIGGVGCLFIKVPEKAEEKAPDAGKLPRDKTLPKMLIPAAAHGAVKEALNLWAPSFFVAVYALDVGGTGWYIYAVPAVALAGRLLFTPLYRLLGGDEMKVAALSMTLCALACVPLLFGVPAAAAAVCLGICSGCAAAANTTVATVYPVRFGQSGSISKVTGLLDFGTYAGGAAATLTLGFVIEKYGYKPVFAVFIALSILSAAIFVSAAQRKKDRIWTSSV